MLIRIDLDIQRYDMFHLKKSNIKHHIYLFVQLFFKAGVIGALEDLRDDTISKILIALQTQMRFNLRSVFFSQFHFEIQFSDWSRE